MMFATLQRHRHRHRKRGKKKGKLRAAHASLSFRLLAVILSAKLVPRFAPPLCISTMISITIYTIALLWAHWEIFSLWMCVNLVGCQCDRWVQCRVYQPSDIQSLSSHREFQEISRSASTCSPSSGFRRWDSFSTIETCEPECSCSVCCCCWKH